MKRYYHLFKTFQNWWLYLLYKSGLADIETLVFETRNGVIVEVPLRLLQTFKEIFIDECYLAGLELGIGSDPTIIDIGANAGYFTLFAVSFYPQAKVFSFEPVPANYAQLQRHCDLNSARKIKCFPQAVAGHSGEINLTFDPSDSFTTSATMFNFGKATEKYLSVPCVTLQELMDKNAIDRCDLLKMNCKGAEYDILYNCPPDYLKRIDQIALEVHRDRQENQNIEALESFFRQSGFFYPSPSGWHVVGLAPVIELYVPIF